MSPPSPLDIIAGALGCDPATLGPSSGLNRHPRWDSLGHVSVMIALEAHYGIAVDTESIRRYERMEAIMELHRQPGRQPEGFDPRWETEVYAHGRMLNEYPSESVVAFVRYAFPDPADRVGKRALDLGCGAGNNLRFLAREGFEALGVDGSPTAIATAQERLKRDGLSAGLQTADVTTLVLPDASFDCAIDRGSLTNLGRADIERALDIVRAALKPGGLFLSEIYSAHTTDRRYARPLGDGSYDTFSKGYFVGLGRVFLAGREDIDLLFGSRFTSRSMEHVIAEDCLGGETMAWWNTVWVR